MTDLDRVVGGLRCRDVLALLPDFVEHELGEDVLARVQTHLHGCDTCEKFGGEYASLVALLRAGHLRVPADSGVRERLKRRLEDAWADEPGLPRDPLTG